MGALAQIKAYMRVKLAHLYAKRVKIVEEWS